MAKLVPLAKNTEKCCLPRNMVCGGKTERIDANRSQFLLYSFRGKVFYTAYCAKLGYNISSSILCVISV